MFLGERRKLVERVILADDREERTPRWQALLPLQRKDFVDIFTAMDGLPVTIRLLDPPLHEFLPDLTELSVKVAVAERDGQGGRRRGSAAAAGAQRLHEQNPMLGLRGVRLGLVPGLFALQVRAIAEAAAQCKKEGKDPRPEIMIPLVGAVQELELIAGRARARRWPRSPPARRRDRSPIGTMIELPRAALTAGADRRGGRVLLLRHQRPDPDHLGLLARRRRGGVLLAVPGEGHLRRLAVRVPGP